MARLSKQQIKLHNQAVKLLEKDELTYDEKVFVFDNWHEAANHTTKESGAFFTPLSMAFDFAIDAQGKRIIDLCAGIGALAFATYHRHIRTNPEIVCIEKNPDYVAVGKKLLPEATWICADVFDLDSLNLGQFDCALSNPPFNKVYRSGSAKTYTGSKFEYHVIDIASTLADYGVFILPQMSSSFVLSGGRNYYKDRENKTAVEFEKLLNITMECGIGIDTEVFADEWKSKVPTTEIVTIEFKDRFSEGEEDTTEPETIHVPVEPVFTKQLTFF